MDEKMNDAVTDNEMDNEPGKRPSKLTFKAMEAKILSIQKERNSGIRQLLKMAKEIEQMMISNESVSDVQIKHEVMWKMYGETVKLQESLKLLVPEDEMSNQNGWFKNQMHKVNGVISKMEKWMLASKEQDKTDEHDDETSVDVSNDANEVLENGSNENDGFNANEVLENNGSNENYVLYANEVLVGSNDMTNGNEDVDNIGPNDSVSNTGGRTNVSRGSSRASRSTTASARIQAEAERAALLAMEAALKEKHELEAEEEQAKAQQERIRKRKELLELQSRIAAQTAKVSVSYVRNRGSDIGSKVSNAMNSYVSKQRSALKPSAVPFVPQTSSCHVTHPPAGGINPPAGPVRFAMPSQPQQLKEQYNQFRPTATMSDRTGTRAKEINSQGTRPKLYASNPNPSMPQRTVQSYPIAYRPQQWQQVNEEGQGSMSQQSHHSYPTAQPAQQSNQSGPGNIFTIMQKQNDITALLVQQQSSLSLPPRNIPTFDGNPLEYVTFIRAFEHGVEAKADSAVDCLYYLEQYTKGQPQELVKSCQHMPPDRGYQRARMLLQERFGNEQKIATAYMEKALGWATLKSEDIKALQAFSLFLRICCNAMENISYMSEMNMPSNIRAIIMKLPYKLREKWRNVAFEHQERRHHQLVFGDVVNFIERQVSIASDPLYGDIQDTAVSFSKLKVGNKLSQGRTKEKGSSFVTSVAPVNSENEKDKYSPDKLTRASCLLCEEGHKLEVCPKMEKKHHRDKIDILKKKGACFGCLSVGHMSKECHKVSIYLQSAVLQGV